MTSIERVKNRKTETTKLMHEKTNELVKLGRGWIAKPKSSRSGMWKERKIGRKIDSFTYILKPV